MLVLAGLPASALASDEVRVEPERGSARTLTMSGLGEPDVREREYTVGGGAGGERRVAITGHSLDRVLRAARVDPYRFGDVEIAAATGGSVALDRDEVTDPARFPDGPPVFYVEDGHVRFLRPAGDGGEPAQVSGAGPLALRLSRSARLEVSAAASKHRTKPGQPVTFTATVAGAQRGEPVEISWYFDDGRSASGRQVTHRFRKPGSYDVVVGATSSADEPGADATVTRQGGKPPKGPDRKGGGTNTSEGAPDSGGGTGAPGAGDSDPGGTGESDPGSGESDPGAGEPDPAATEPAGAEERRRARERRAARGARRAASDAAPSSPSPDGAAPDAAGAQPVRGIELADLDALSGPAGRDALGAARRGRLRDERDAGPRVPPGVWWTLGTMALLAAGGWREARPARPIAR